MLILKLILAVHKIAPAIASGNAISQTTINEFLVKIASGKALATITEESEATPGADAATDTPPDGKEEPKAAAVLEAEMKKINKIETKSPKAE